VTEELFLKDAYLKVFEARVVRLAGREVILDRTAVYPGGGGQPADRGSLGIGPVRASVVNARREGDDIVHVLDTAIPDTVRELNGELDWELRYARMRYHTCPARALWCDLGGVRREGDGWSDARGSRPDGLFFPR
jgi:Ser-tRNA(Ala) deacylase AlaX